MLPLLPTAVAPPEVEGLLVCLDTLARELTVLTADGRFEVDVPPGCPVLLHGEAVRLRLLQPGDTLRVRLRQLGARRVASEVRVEVLRGGRADVRADVAG